MKDNPLILVVDDRLQNIELFEAYLVPQGYEIIKATSGEEALEKLSGYSIDLILLDVMMKGMNGFDVTRRVRQDNSHTQLPIILVTALQETQDRVKGIEAGCNDFISKPVDKTELLARVRSLLKIKDYNDLIQRQNEQLLDLNREKNKFISIIAHDLNNAFVGIIGLTDILLSNFENTPQKEKIEIIEMLHNSGQSAYQLLKGLLNWSLLNREAVNISLEVFKINEIAEEIGTLFKGNFSTKEITFEMKITDQQGFGDKEMIKTVLRNLVANAIKFTPKKGRILITGVSDKSTTKVTVEDSGIGMNSKTIEKLFKFDTIFSTKGTENEVGTGLGLILCKEIIEKNGGKISVKSIEGKGSKFTFAIPFSDMRTL